MLFQNEQFLRRLSELSEQPERRPHASNLIDLWPTEVPRPAPLPTSPKGTKISQRRAYLDYLDERYEWEWEYGQEE